MRKVIVAIMVVTLILLSAPAALGATTVVKVDGKQIYFDVDPINEKGRILVPMRSIFEAMGAVVNWDEKTQTVMAGNDKTLIVMKIGQMTAQKDNVKVNLDCPAKLVRWRTMVPLRFVGEALGATVAWDSNTKTVEITSPKPVIQTPTTPPVVTNMDGSPTDVNTALGKLFGTIGDFSDYKFTASVEENTVAVNVDMNNYTGVQTWRNMTTTAREDFLSKIIDQIRDWYPEKSINILVRYTYYSQKSSLEDGDIFIQFVDGHYEVKRVQQIGSANYFKSMEFVNINPLS